MEEERSSAAFVATALGFVLLVALGFVYIAAGLIVPGPWLVLLWLVWIGLFIWAVVHRQDPPQVLATPVVAAVVWVVVVYGLGTVFDWEP